MHGLSAIDLVIENGSFNATSLAADVTKSSGDVIALIGFAMLAAIALGVLYAIYLLLTQGS